MPDANFLNDKRISSISLKKSKWSASTFKMIPTSGFSSKKLFVYSQASVRNVCPLPTRILPPICASIPPKLIVGSV